MQKTTTSFRDQRNELSLNLRLHFLKVAKSYGRQSVKMTPYSVSLNTKDWGLVREFYAVQLEWGFTVKFKIESNYHPGGENHIVDIADLSFDELCAIEYELRKNPKN